MLATFRRSLNTWPARLLFGLLVVAFGVWGIGDVVRNIGRSGAPASVAGRRIELAELQQAFQRNLAQTTRNLGNTDPTPELRRSVAMQTVAQVVTQTALQANAERLGLAVPDDALRRAVFAMPAFHDKSGKFDRAQMDAVLRNNGLSEPRFLAMLRDQLMQQQMLGAVSAGASASEEMARQVYQFQHEKRVADAVTIPLAAAPPPPAPSAKQLERWWANHPDRFSTPEYRRIRAIVLTPETVAKDVQVTEEDLKAAWEQHKGEFNTPEHRSVEVILTQDEAEAERLAEQWRSGADWAAMQDAASKSGAAPVEMTDATRSEFPAPELGDAVFATPEGTVPPPVHSALGWYVLKVTKVVPGKAQDFEQARDALRARVVAEKAADLIYDRANRIDNLLSSGSSLENLPGDLGVAAVTGTLDAQGETPQGQKAPIPGPEPLRQALIAAAFQARPGEAPKLTQAPNAPDGSQSFYAVSVESITPPAPRPFEQVAEQVRADWTGDQVRREQEETAAKLLHSVDTGKSLADAAAAAGLRMETLPAAGRDAPTPGVPPALIGPLFALKKPGEATMVQTRDGFIVAALAKIEDPDPKSDPAGWSAVREALAQAVGADMQELFAQAVRDRSNPRINASIIDTLAGANE
jgi:peptidyl-prolyl cis-trans isomerase D